MESKYTQVTKLWADMGYQGKNLKSNINDKYSIDLEVIKRPQRRFWVHQDTAIELLPKVEAGFKIQPKRWIVERTFAWIGRNRRLSKEYEFNTNSSENFIYLAMNRLILRRNHA
jgi:putative transposase